MTPPAAVATRRTPRAGSAPFDSPTRGRLADARIGVVPIIWNNADLPDLAPHVPWDEVLDEISRLGYQGLQRGVGFPSGAELAGALEARDLRLAEVYVSLPCGRDGPAEDALAIGRGALAELHDANGDVLVVALERSADRDPFVGRAADAPALSDAGIARLADLLGTLARDVERAGHRLAFHNHGATYVETAAEIDRLLAATDPELVGLCLDVGHAILGGADPLDLLDRHAQRVAHAHLKDVDPAPLRSLREGQRTGFTVALEARIFTPLGSGVLDLPGVLQRLERQGYRGWLMIEQDTSWEPASEAAAIGRRVLDAALRWMADGAMGEGA